MDLDSLADRLDKLSNRRSSFEAVRHVNELFTTDLPQLGKSFASTGLLESALQHARIRKHFREFIQHAYATENLNFYEAVVELEQCANTANVSHDTLLLQAKAIIKQYIQVQASTPVNLPSSLTQRIRDMANNGEIEALCELLSTAKREILHLMQTNFFYKFLATVVRRDDPVVEIPLPPTQASRSFVWATSRASRSSTGGGIRGTSPEKVKKARRAYSLLLMDAIGRRKSSKRAATPATEVPVKTWVDVHVLLQESEASLLTAAITEEQQNDEDEEIKVKVHDKEEWTMVIRTSQRFTPESIAATAAPNPDANKRYSNRLRAISQHDRQLCQDYLQRAASQRGLDAHAVEEIQSQIKALESFEREVGGATVELERDEEIKLLELITNNNNNKKELMPKEKMNPNAVLAIVFAILCYWFLFAR